MVKVVLLVWEGAVGGPPGGENVEEVEEEEVDVVTEVSAGGEDWGVRMGGVRMGG